jgi:hypothetical protein
MFSGLSVVGWPGTLPDRRCLRRAPGPGAARPGRRAAALARLELALDEHAGLTGGDLIEHLVTVLSDWGVV